MTRVFAADVDVPVTALLLEGCQVIGVKKNENREVAVTKGEQVGTRQTNDGYTAVVLAAGCRRPTSRRSSAACSRRPRSSRRP